jgi:hypothetical protein
MLLPVGMFLQVLQLRMARIRRRRQPHMAATATTATMGRDLGGATRQCPRPDRCVHPMRSAQ